jgi:hypothetical protein
MLPQWWEQAKREEPIVDGLIHFRLILGIAICREAVGPAGVLAPTNLGRQRSSLV